MTIAELNIIEGGHQFDSKIVQQGMYWLNEGIDVGLMSEAGSPAIADPGAEFVLKAHKNQIKVVPLVGPNSIFMALMASGLGGQHFCFHGYLPNKKEALITKLKFLANNKSLHSYTHICIETPYRNKFLFEHLKSVLAKNTYLCIASGIQSAKERILTKSLSDWNLSEIELIHKVPSIFLFKFSN
jgi:16S rRNA (cytidine1402-2'-O)-methyltransferase